MAGARTRARAGARGRDRREEGEEEAPGGLEARVAALEARQAGAEAELRAQVRALQARLAEAERRAARQAAAAAAGLAPDNWPAWRNWAGGLPAGVLEKVAEKVVAQSEAGSAAWLKEEFEKDGFWWHHTSREEEDEYWSEGSITKWLARRKREGNSLFVFARVCKEWRKAQIKVGGPLRTRVWLDVLLPGRVALAKWALAEGCPRESRNFFFGFTLAIPAAYHGHLELVKWLCGEGGFEMDKPVMQCAAESGNLELVQWLKYEGCPLDCRTSYLATKYGHVEVLRWVRENGCPWWASTRDRAAAELGYTDDFGNLVDSLGNQIRADDDDEIIMMIS